MPQDAQAACPPPRGGFQPRGQNLARAQATYGEALPDWIAALARACDASTQREVAAQLGLSQPTVSRCCRTRVRQCYHIEELVRQLLMPAALDGLAPALMPDARLDARPDAQLANAFRRLADAQALAGRLAQALAEAQQLLFALQPQQIPQQVPQQMEVEHVHARESDHS
ncbi:hypothetical protein DGI_0927 [Megalodesulfovibrio gigas DSM 1382 = ATCC 19364]|uniref:Uncharacterized protein n=2 Tax=Megalodesulfovibrio gigas TaxID=879 RepID=T2G8A0_MEGG1|nr:hypothetical protein DGI_0927 [Megalodesulfovibrio gigas DSM 1382 = ATCC 19364]